ncbi:MAG: C25 family cysteine peptidase [Chloroflexota bacterium]
MSNPLTFNGVNGATGQYGLPPMSEEELSEFIVGEGDPENLAELRKRHSDNTTDHLGVKEGVDPTDLGEAGWGVIFAHNADPAIKEALSPLLKLREEQAGEYYQLYEKGAGYRVGKDTKGKFLARHGMSPGPADPEKVPYYLMIVGDPETIDFRFQSQLDVQYAVGRVDFGDDLDAYNRYAQSVVKAEQEGIKLPRDVSFFGVANDDDGSTKLSLESLISPLVAHLKDNDDWHTHAFLKEAATKSQLSQLLGGDQTPALLFTASHGMEFPLGDARQIPHQGALLCQDWPGPINWKEAIPQDHYLAGDDLPRDANLLGLLSFFFACYGGGTPRYDEFAKQAFKERAEIAPHAFTASLPNRMLSNPGGGALAVIGHVERAWGYSFHWENVGAQTTVFESVIDRLLDGHPVGSAVEYLNERYAELSTVLSDEIEEIDAGRRYDALELAGMWTANNDARGYTIIGDPAVRLAVADVDEAVDNRPVVVFEPREEASLSAAETTTVETEPSSAATIVAHDDIDFEAMSNKAGRDADSRTLVSTANGATASELREQYLDIGGELKSQKHNVETLIVFLEGKATVTISGEANDVVAPATVVVPADIMHSIKAKGSKEVHLMVFFAGPNPETDWE